MHIFSDYNQLEVLFTNKNQPHQIEKVHSLLVATNKGNMPFEFVINGVVIDFPGQLGSVSGETLDYLSQNAILSKYKAIYAYDIESYRNFFSVIFININNHDDEKTFIVYKGRDDRQALRQFLNNPLILVGFNNVGFDDMLLKDAITNNAASRNFLTASWELSQAIIQRKKTRRYWELRKQPFRPYSIDLMAIMALDKKGVSLKRAGIIMAWPKIQDLPINYLSEICDNDLDLLLSYNKNDVHLTIELYHYIHSEIETRLEVGRLFNLNLMSASRSKMGDEIMTRLYQDRTKKRVSNGHDTRLLRESIDLKDCIGNITFTSKTLQALKQSIESTTVTFPKYTFEKTIEYGGKFYDLGVGGLHSQDSAGKYSSNSEYHIIDCDVASFYPFIMINDEIFPEQLGRDFITVYEDIVRERINAKKEGNRAMDYALKIAINSVFGKLGNGRVSGNTSLSNLDSKQFYHSWLYDKTAFLRVTINGQLYLLSLIEKLVLAGIEVISANTDGIVSRVHVDQLDRYNQICQEWSKSTKFDLEFTTYNKYVRRDVNNYLAQTLAGKIKTKGIFSVPVAVDGGYRPAIIPTALQNFFLYDKLPIETIAESESISDFLYAQKVGGNFEVFYETVSNGVVELLPQQKNNRYYVSNSGGTLLKRSESGSNISLVAGEHCRILNEIETFNPKNYDIKAAYYLAQIEKIIHIIEPIQQAALF